MPAVAGGFMSPHTHITQISWQEILSCKSLTGFVAVTVSTILVRSDEATFVAKHVLWTEHYIIRIYVHHITLQTQYIYMYVLQIV